MRLVVSLLFSCCLLIRPGLNQELSSSFTGGGPPPTPRPPTCRPEEATCSDGTCIPRTAVCNGIYDCNDGSDENRCSGGRCQPNEFQCANGRCILKTWRCDSDDDCGDNSDEESCSTNPPGAPCGYNEWQCLSRDQCIPKSFHCDGEMDCQDQSDETGCTPPIIVVSPPHQVIVDLEQTFIINCTALGIPTPEIVWRLNWGHVPDKCSMTSDGQPGNRAFGELTCPSAGNLDQGAYSCEAINSKGSCFAGSTGCGQPGQDAMVIIRRPGEGICPAGSFNAFALRESECLQCFCFGVTDDCFSSELYMSEVAVPNDGYVLLGVDVSASGQVNVRPEVSSDDSGDEDTSLVARILEKIRTGQKIFSSNPRIFGSRRFNDKPYLQLPIEGSQTKAYGGNLRFTLTFNGRGSPVLSPDVIIQGNDVTIVYIIPENELRVGVANQIVVPFVEGRWFKSTVVRGGQVQGVDPASREDIIMALDNPQYFLIKGQFRNDIIDTSVSDITISSANPRDQGQGRAIAVEQCQCPIGYTGLSCEECAPGYQRRKVGQWKGECVKEVTTCPRGYYGDPQNGIDCQVCPCPMQSPPNQFTSECYLDVDRQVTCRCPPGYEGRRCDSCAAGYVGNPTVTGDYCKPGPRCDVVGSERPQPNPRTGTCDCRPGYSGPSCSIPPLVELICDPNGSYRSQPNPRTGLCDCRPGWEGPDCSSPSRPERECNPYGSFSETPDPSTGSCQCRLGYSGPTCSIPPVRSCPAGEFLSTELNGGSSSCISCFCMGIPGLDGRPSLCQSSNLYRDKELSVFAYDSLDFTLVDPEQNDVITDFNVDEDERELVFRYFQDLQSRDYFWRLPSQYLGNRLSSYGGELRFGLRNDPEISGDIYNYGPLVELKGNDIRILHYSPLPDSDASTKNFQVRLIESDWQRQDGQRMSREHLLMALANIEYILIRANFGNNVQEVGLSDVSMDIAVERYTPSGQASSVERCSCPTGYKGLSCETCAPGYTRSEEGLYLGLCRPCNCYGKASICDPDTGKCFGCRDNTMGQNCEQCLPGYRGDPTRGLECVLPEGTEPLPCDCYQDGSISADCIDEQCQCKENVIGQNCDRCAPGTFGLIGTNPQGCHPCWCSGVTDQCTEASLSWSTVRLNILNEDHGVTLTDKSRQNDFTELVQFGNRQILFSPPEGSSTLFWSLPSQFLGNKIEVYGGNLTLTQRFFGDGDLVEEPNIILVGNGVSLHWNDPDQKEWIQGEDKTYIVSMMESEWDSLNGGVAKPATREDMLTALANIESILIRATITDQDVETSLKRITADIAVPQVTGFQARGIEECQCLPGYRGGSCQNCDYGFYRDPNDRSEGQMGKCKRCDCNGNEQSCHMGEYEQEGQLICVCRPGYFGSQCENSESGPTETRPEVSEDRIIVTITEPLIQIVEVGQTARFQCNASPTLTPEGQIKIRWDKKDGRLPFRRSNDNRNGLLVITEIQTTDGGTYVCTATDGVYIYTAETQLRVKESSDVPRVPTVRITPQYLRLNVGDRAEFTCMVEGNPTPRIIWRASAGNIYENARIDGNQLIFDRVRKADEGEYYCSATNSQGNAQDRVMIFVFGTDSPQPTEPTEPDVDEVPIEVLPGEITTEPGQEIRLTCNIRGSGFSITWSKQSGRLPYNSRQENNVLVLPNVSSQDDGVYICVGVKTSTGERIEATATITIVDYRPPPTVKIEPENQIVPQGTKGMLRCVASNGNPLSDKIIWEKAGDENFASNPNIVIDNYVLTILNTQIDDRGVYTCTVESPSGAARNSAILDVERREIPSLEIFPGPVVEAVAGQSILLQCRVMAGIPDPEVSWSRTDGRPIGSRVELLPGGVLRMNEISNEEAGMYKCKASNVAGVAELTTNIVIQEPPSVSLNPTGSNVVRVGSQMILTCSVRGNPLPSVTWEKMGQEAIVLRSNIQPTSSSSLVATYTIPQVSKADEGAYLCRATSEAGRSEDMVQIIVNNDQAGGNRPNQGASIRPGVEVDQAEFNAPIGGNAELKCFVVGNLGGITSRWVRMDGRPLPRNSFERSGILYLRDLKREDSGQYACEGERNGQRLFQAVTNLLVSAPPRLELDPEKQIVRPGDNARINCITTGDPPVKLSWDNENQSLPRSVIVRGGVIEFRQIAASDEGKYICTGTNQAGRATAIAEVIVQGDEIKIYWLESVLYNPEGIRVDIPLYTFSIPSNGTAFGEDDSMDTGRGGGDISPEYDTDDENYPPVEPYETLIEFVGAKLSEEDQYSYSTTETYNTRPGNSVDLICRLSGYVIASEPVWSKDGGPIPEKAQILPGILRIPDVQESDSGRYICSDGESRQYIYLRIDRYEGYSQPEEVRRSSVICRDDQFHCAQKEECVERAFVCDGEFDCTDGSDEWNCQRSNQEEAIALNSEVVISPSQENYRIGENLDLSCTLKGDESLQRVSQVVSWSKMSGENLGRNTNQIGDLLRFNGLNKENEGIYKCEIRINNLVLEQNFHLIVEGRE